MTLPMNKLVFEPSVAMVGNTMMSSAGLIDAVEQMGAIVAAETPSTPLNNLIARTHADGLPHGGNGDDLAEFSGRQCYRSWTQGRDPAEYHENIRSQGHGSIYEHASVNFQITGVSRTLTHELIRHRVGTAYSQESQRYVDAKDIRFVVPPLLTNAIEDALGFTPRDYDDLADLPASTRRAFTLFSTSCENSLGDYINLQPLLVEMAAEAERLNLEGDEKAAVSVKKRANEAARSVLHNAAETRLVFTINLRELRHVLTLRGDEPADLEIRRLAVSLFPHAVAYAPYFFSDLTVERGTDGINIVNTKEAKRI